MNKILSIALLFFLKAFLLEIHASYDSISLQGRFDHGTNARISAPFNDALDKIASDQGLYFTKVKPENYHISIVTVQPLDDGQKLGSHHITDLCHLAKKHLNSHGYEGHFYKLFLFVGGYDAQGNEINYHYGDLRTAQTVLKPKYGFGGEGYKATRAHIVLRFGTRTSEDADGQPGLLKRDVDAMLKDLDKNKQSHGFKDTYEKQQESQGYTSHLTIGVMKSFVGKAHPSDPPLDLGKVLGIYRSVHISLARPEGQNLLSQAFTLSSFVFNGCQQVGRKMRYTALGSMDDYLPKVPMARTMDTYALPIKHYGEIHPKDQDYALIVIKSTQDQGWRIPHRMIQNPSHDAVGTLIQKTLGSSVPANCIAHAFMAGDSSFYLCRDDTMSVRAINAFMAQNTQCRALPVASLVRSLSGNMNPDALTSRGAQDPIVLEQGLLQLLRQHLELFKALLNQQQPGPHFA